MEKAKKDSDVNICQPEEVVSSAGRSVVTYQDRKQQFQHLEGCSRIKD